MTIKKIKPMTNLEMVVKIHRSWGTFNPRDRVVESKKVYNRKREKRSVKDYVQL